MELAQIAHPKFRDDLVREARKHHYIFADQLPPTQEDLLFLEGYKSSLKVKGGKTIEFRPILPTDEFSSRNFFYSLQDKTIFSRFFYKISIFSHEMAQRQWASVDYRKNMSIIGLVQKGGYKDIIAIGTYANVNDIIAEIAFVVREDFQNKGVASYLLGVLENIAVENGYKQFLATVLKENTAMLHVFTKRYPNAQVITKEMEIEVLMPFNLSKPKSMRNR
jgi:GNAT superfamily N-acetyltransferase